MNFTHTLIARRTFLKAALPLFGFGLGRIIAIQTPVERGKFGPADLPWIRDQLLQLVNNERAAVGAPPLALDDLASRVALEHAVDMATGDFLSHWGRDGRKPYQRYSFAGGSDAMEENVSAAENIASITPKGVANDLADMHAIMHAEVPPNDGHRQAMLAPQHTHVGFGVGLNERSLRLAEIYVSRYVHIDPIPQQAKVKATVVLTGRLLNANHFLHEVDVFYEPLPKPPDANWLRTPRPYALPDNRVQLRPKAPGRTVYTDGTRGDYEWSRDGTFRVPAKLSEDLPGIYTVVFWLRRVPVEKAFQAAQICIRAE